MIYKLQLYKLELSFSEFIFLRINNHNYYNYLLDDCLLYHLDSIYVYQYVRISKHFLIVFLFDIPCEQLHQLLCVLVNNRHVSLQTVCVVYFLLSTLPVICHPSYSFSLIFWRLLITGLVFCPKSVVVWMSLCLKSVSGNLEDIHLLEHCLLNVHFLKL